MDFHRYLANRKVHLLDYLHSFISKEERAIGDEFTNIALERLAEFATRGKLLRGIFVMMGYEMFAERKISVDSISSYPDCNVLNIAAAMELSQSALLIHDDIMDNDTLRRGDKTIFARYITDAIEHNIENSEEYGKSMGMIVGDASFFLTYELIGGMDVESGIRSKIMNRYSKEMLKVALGQFLDYHYGMTPEERSPTEISRVYRLKTGSYTFTLPCVLGAYIAGKTDQDLIEFEKVTSHLGTIFQIKDDEIGLFGDPKVTGKPLGSDIIENKKTLFRAELFAKATAAEKEKLKSIFGRPCSSHEISYVQSLLKSYGIVSRMQSTIETLSQESKDRMKNIPISQEYRSLFENLIDFNSLRKS